MSALNPIGTPFIELPTVGSTNNYAMGLVREGMAQHGTAVFAHEQTMGKGQRNREWKSMRGKNIAISIIIEPAQSAPVQIFLLSKVLALATHQFVRSYVKDQVSIKWPNDIYWRDRKAAGILIENIWQGREWKYAIAGIGININQENFDELGKKAVSFKQITGLEYEPLLLAKELCGFIEQEFKNIYVQPEKIAQAYRASLYKLNEKVKLKKDNRVFEAWIRDVTNDGALVVEHAIKEQFSMGEIEWVV